MPRVKVMCHSSAGLEKSPCLPAACDQAGECEWRGFCQNSSVSRGCGWPRWETGPSTRGPGSSTLGLYITCLSISECLCPLLFVSYRLLRLLHCKDESQAQESLDRCFVGFLFFFKKEEKWGTSLVVGIHASTAGVTGLIPGWECCRAQLGEKIVFNFCFKIIIVFCCCCLLRRNRIFGQMESEWVVCITLN